MLEEMIVTYCAPTLAGLKTGGLFNFSCNGSVELSTQINHCNTLLNPKGVHIVSLRLKEGRALIYVYRPIKLAAVLRNMEARDFLLSMGYRNGDMGNCIDLLANRLTHSEDFPHEIGLFLGYPLPDVKAFIENKGQNCKCLGCWKVYTDEANAKRSFAQFDRCTKIYRQKFMKDKSILRLTVAA